MKVNPLTLALSDDDVVATDENPTYQGDDYADDYQGYQRCPVKNPGRHGTGTGHGSILAKYSGKWRHEWCTPVVYPVYERAVRIGAK